MPKDSIHHGGWEHRDVHNLNGMAYVGPFSSVLHAISSLNRIYRQTKLSTLSRHVRTLRNGRLS